MSSGGFRPPPPGQQQFAPQPPQQRPPFSSGAPPPQMAMPRQPGGPAGAPRPAMPMQRPPQQQPMGAPGGFQPHPQMTSQQPGAPHQQRPPLHGQMPLHPGQDFPPRPGQPRPMAPTAGVPPPAQQFVSRSQMPSQLPAHAQQSPPMPSGPAMGSPPQPHLSGPAPQASFGAPRPPQPQQIAPSTNPSQFAAPQPASGALPPASGAPQGAPPPSAPLSSTNMKKRRVYPGQAPPSDLPQQPQQQQQYAQDQPATAPLQPSQPQHSATMQPPYSGAFNPGQAQPPQQQYIQRPGPGAAVPPRPPMQQHQQQQPGQPPLPSQQQQQQPPPTSIQPGGQQVSPGGNVQRPKTRIDPDMIPSPVQVMETDQRSQFSKPYSTNTAYATDDVRPVPPLASSVFTAVDEGNANPRFIRMTLNCVPQTPQLQKSSHVPLAAVIQPLAELSPDEKQIQLVDLPNGPVRCNRCKAYVNPYMAFVDGGRRFNCNICFHSNECPENYFCNLDHAARRHDIYERPELLHGSIEFAATKEFCLRDPKPPAYVFAIDVSYASLKSGVINAVSRTIERLLDSFPRPSAQEPSPVRIGLVTYDKDVHFYNLSPRLTQPQMMVISDIDDVFVPLHDGFLVNIEESRSLIEALLQQLPVMFEDTRETEVAMGAAVRAAAMAMKECGGKLFVFQCELPSLGPGKLKNREDNKLLGTDKENTLFQEQDAFYSKLGEACVGYGVSVDLFLFPHASYTDVATLSELARVTAGEVRLYRKFLCQMDEERFAGDLGRHITRTTGFDAVLRVRASTGLRAVKHHGNFFTRNVTDIEMAAVDCDAALGVLFDYDDKLPINENGPTNAAIQVALLYTTITGARRIRVHNLSLRTSSQLADVFRCAELDTLMNYISKGAIVQIMQKPLEQVRKSVSQLTVAVLGSYRKNCATASSTGQLILPEALKLMPAYMASLLRNPAFLNGQEVSPDMRVHLYHRLRRLSVPNSIVYFYPRIIDLALALENPFMPILPTVRASMIRIENEKMYLCENGFELVLWVGLGVPSSLVQAIFNVSDVQLLNVTATALPELENSTSTGVRKIISRLRNERKEYMQFRLCRQKDASEGQLYRMLVEDGHPGCMNYVDYLCYTHKEIQHSMAT